MSNSIRKLLCATALAVPLITSSPASAQNASVQSGGPDNELGEIVVTANKREQSVQNVAAGITALSGVDLQERGINNPNDLQFVVPSMEASVGNHGESTVSIRGVGYNEVGSPGVAVHVDGVYQPRPGMGDISQLDIARVEVLRGPQGTVYGRNANGGVINYLTKAPDSDFSGYAKGSYQNYDEYHVEGAVNVPLNEHFAARLTATNWERGNGFIENVVPGNPDLDKGRGTSGRLHLTGELTSDLTVDLIATAVKRSGATVYLVNIDQPSTLPTAIIPTGNRTSANFPSLSDRNYFALTGIVEWKIGDWQIRSTTGYQRFQDNFQADFDGTNIDAVEAHGKMFSKTFTQELDLIGAVGPVNATFGAFYMDDRLDNNFYFVFPIGFGPLQPGGTVDNTAQPYNTKAHAAFADLTWNISDRLRLISGLRYSNDKQSVTQTNLLTRIDLNFPFPPQNVLPVLPTCPGVTSDVTFNSTTPRFGAQYDLSSRSNVYATYSKGFKVGGFNYRSNCGDLFEPETVTSYEVGWKNRLLDGTLILNASAFHYDYSNFQVEQVVGLSSEIDNAPRARVQGVELESNWRPDKHWSVNATLSLIDAKFVEFFNVNGAQLLPPPAVTPPTNLAGHHLPRVPEQSGNFGIAYETDPVVLGGTLTFRGDLSHRSDTTLREFELPGDIQKAYTLLGASIRWAGASQRYGVRLYGTNLTDKIYRVLAGESSGVGARFTTYGPPRQYGIELTAKF